MSVLAPIMWNAELLALLEGAIDLAIETDAPTVKINLAKRYRKPKMVEWPVSEATSIAVSVRGTLHESPMPTFGENREGEEP